MLICEGAVSDQAQEKPLSLFQSLAEKAVLLLKKPYLLSTLFIGIDISSRNNVVALLDFESRKPLQTCSVANNQLGAMELAQHLLKFLNSRPDL